MEKLNKISIRITAVGIIVNAVLCAVKLFMGYYSKSIAIVSDGFNNLSDIGNALLIFIAYRIAAKPADKDHPYGHGRIENMLSQGISLMIMSVGISLFTSSIDRIAHPREIIQDTRIIVMLAISILVKLGLAWYYRHFYVSTRLNSIKAQISDSISDAAGNLVILLSYVLTPHTTVYLDGFIGILVSLMIIYGGFRIFRETSSILIGRASDDALVKEINDILMDDKQVLGVHDIRIHSYGLDSNYASADVEVNGRTSFVKVHDLLDTLEEVVKERTGVMITLHGDPVSDSSELNQIKKIIKETIDKYDGISYHDLHYNRNLSSYHVDLSVPYSYDLNKNDIIAQLNDLIHEYNRDIRIQINIDRH